MPLKGLAALGEFRKKQEDRKAAQQDRVKVPYFKFEKGKPNTVTVRFLQEFDEAAENYDERFGVVVTEIEHEAPGKDGFYARATCTKEEEGFCYACDRKRADYDKENPNNNWKTKTNTYVKALISVDGAEPELGLISRNYNSSFTQALIQDAIDDNTITDANYRITKIGDGTETQWLLKKLRGEPFEIPESFDNEFSIEEHVLRNIKYDDQPEWYGKHYKGKEAESTEAESSATEGEATPQDKPGENNEW